MENQNPPTVEVVPEPIKNISYLKIIVMCVLLIGISISATYWYLSNKNQQTSQKSVTSTNKFCEGVNIAFFPGGNESDSFASVVYNGAKQAEKDLGANVNYIWSDWDSNKMITQFVDVIATSPDAIAIMGHPGSSNFKPFIDEAERKNIIITSQNVDLPDLREKYSSKGFGYVGQSLYDSGLMVSSAIIRKYNPSAGAEAIVFGVSSTTSPSRYQRTKGNIDGLKNGNVIVHEIAMTAEVEKDLKSTAAQNMISDALKTFPKTSIIITDHGALTASIPTLLKDIGKKPGEIIVAGFDLSVDTANGIKSGYLDLVLDQQPYLQGYLPILQACLTKKYGFAGLNINTGMGLIDKSNIDVIASLAEQKIR